MSAVLERLGDAEIRRFIADDGAAIQRAQTVIGGVATWGNLLRFERMPSWSVWREGRPIGAMVIHSPLPALGELHAMAVPRFPPLIALALARWVVAQAWPLGIVRLQAVVSRGHLAGHRLMRFAGLPLEHVMPSYFGAGQDGLLYAKVVA